MTVENQSPANPDSASEISLTAVKERSVKGIVVLTGRTFILQIISLVAQLFLFAYLGGYEFGVFAIVSAIVNFLVYFSDIGLAAALIQKKEKPTDTDLKTTFVVQQLLILCIVVVIFLLTPFFSSKYGLDSKGTYLLYALSISLFMSSLKSIPSVLLERRLEFVKLVFPQILEQVVYNVALVICAMRGLGVTSFTIAVLLRGVVGLVGIYLMEPWKPGFAFSLNTLKGLFKFGIPYQVNTFLATFKDDGMTLILGGILGPVGVGVLSFAQKIARLPLTFFMDTVTRVTFPAFARMQDQKNDLARSVTRSIFFICLLVFPTLMAEILLAPILIGLIPRYSHWQPAMIPLIFVGVNFMFAAATTQLTNLLNAIGKIKTTFYLMIMWTMLTWLFIPLLSIKFGVIGASLGYALVGASSIIAIYEAKKHVNFSITDSMLKPLIGTMLMGITMYVVRLSLPATWNSVFILSITGSAVYLTSMLSLIGISLIDDVKRSFKTVFAKH